MKKIFCILAIMTPLMFATSAFGQTSNTSGVQAVDVGLSGLWADRNVGADSPSDYGDYYAWGEISVKANYSWITYKWCKSNGSNTRLTKYNTDSSYGIVDNKTKLEAADDVAHVKLGGNWRMPTKSELQELIATKDNPNYKWEWKVFDGHNGWEITYLNNNNSIFLPAAGFSSGADHDDVGSSGSYWSSSYSEDYPNDAGYIFFDSEEVFSCDFYLYGGRCNGRSIRPVTK